MMICDECGAAVANSATRCWKCRCLFDEEEVKVEFDTKVNRIINAQIAAKAVEFENANGYGPTIAILIGLFGFFMIYPLLFFVGGIIWSFINSGTRDRIDAEIKVLELQREE